jgi:hypothetical protein
MTCHSFNLELVISSIRQRSAVLCSDTTNMLPRSLIGRQLGNSHFPCPSGNETQIGDIQKFNVLCGLDIGGVEIDRMQVDSMNTCVGLWYVLKPSS